ncbi:Gfo/Idh/MocA family protein [Xanthobacter agilis]|uniref:Dehydrogenase n=1 Tax=Xanthobacter agilis TaxID=47492 RepID=A0ABU0LBT8_XANAG|nr:Gfo/Idh/MocA family oxidoreductase [Xanthobacter agilis]MDQ0504609.1 putative dehydrogenase [Xanthobacter agilis]
MRFAVIGFGGIGRRRANIIDKRQDFDFVAACDVQVAETTVPFYTDWRQLLDKEQLDGVFVCTTNDVIADVVVTALGRGLHVFSEKPPGRNVADILRMRDAEAAAPGKVLKFGFNHRFHPSVLKAAELIDSGAFGRLLTLRGAYGKSGGYRYETNWRNDPERSGGGILIDQGIHMLDLMSMFCPELSVIASQRSKSYWDTAVEDNAMVLLASPEGAMASLHSSATQWKHLFRLELGLEKGLIVLDGILSGTGSYAPEVLLVYRTALKDGYPVPNPVPEVSAYEVDDSWDREVAEFAAAIHGEAPLRHGTSDDALRIMQLVAASYDTPVVSMIS